MDDLEGTRIITPLQLVRRHAEESQFVEEPLNPHGSEHPDDTTEDDDEDLAPVEANRKLNEDIHDAFVAKEAARLADCAGWCVMLSLLAVGGVLATIAYFYFSGQEEDDFESEFAVVANEVMTGVQSNSDQLYTQLQSLARLFSSKSDGSSGNFVTVTEFEAFASTLRKSFGLAALVYSPWLTNNTQRDEWGLYSSSRAQDWLEASFAWEGWTQAPPTIRDYVWRYEEDPNTGTGVIVEDLGPAPYAPAWEWSAPPTNNNSVNSNFNRNSIYFQMANQSNTSYISFVSQPFDLQTLYGPGFTYDDTLSAYSVGLVPVSASLQDAETITGHLSVALPWTTLFRNILQSHQIGITVVVDSCSGTAINTYTLQGSTGPGNDVTYVGAGDLHSTKYDEMVLSQYYYGFANRTSLTGLLYCKHKVSVYPSDAYQDSFTSNSAIIYTVTIAAIMFFAIVLFLSYDCIIRRQQSKVLGEAERSNAIVASLFPGKVARRLFLDTSRHSASGLDMSEGRSTHSVNLLNFMNKGDFKIAEASKPIAELFPDATVLFADIAGFTAWSSIREPSQVFTLLESIFQSFDVIAKSFGVFKVETVGDCYVACCGVPEANEDHATVMAQFARECMRKFDVVVQDLELKLGPDTSDLAIRIGLNSGPVTAGVLRGERARFQLFGDTVNTAARMESTGQKGRIHLSEQTANILIAQGRGSWVKPREDKVAAKGKGILSTYWLQEEVAAPRLWSDQQHAPKPRPAIQSNEDSGTNLRASGVLPSRETASKSDELDTTRGRAATAATVVAASRTPEQAPSAPTTVTAPSATATQDRKTQRLIDWNTELLMQLLKQVVARRYAVQGRSRTPASTLWEMARNMGQGHMPVEEVVEVIVLPDFDERAIRQVDPETVILSPEVTSQCRNYVAMLASMYRQNPFHNFEHASHVTMSVSKLLSRIVAPEVDKEKLAAGMHQELLLHDHTYGITSDPLTQFSVVLSALIHDVDHRGVPNFLLIAEDARLAAVYQKKSVAEQNSVDMAWNALMRPEFAELRSCIFSDLNELKRFRALVVNSVIATDIFDKELGTLRKNRWAKAFEESGAEHSHRQEDVNRKATIVIEHLIQASDVAHTMQHWHVYQKWNERLFQEMYQAHLTGRWDKDPSPNWYQGEIGFFDNYIIPLAKKLKDCGVFGVASDEYLNYALQNRREWDIKGQEIVAKLAIKYGPPPAPPAAPKRNVEECKVEL